MVVLIVLALVWARQGAIEGADDLALPQAYIGPGAGIALLGSFFAVFSGFISAIFFAITYPIRLIWRTLRGGRALRRAKARRVIVLGLDGLEPTLTERFMDEGQMPNLRRMRDEGCYGRLGTTCPPLSPVAWSSFATGANPGKHNIFDFIARHPRTYQPRQSSISLRPPRRTLNIGRLVVPLSRPDIRGLRRSKPFWTVLGERGIFSAVLRVPITFPPDRFRGVQLSAMCVPDLRGTHGTFSYIADHDVAPPAQDGEVGGDVIRAERDGDTVRAFLRGPHDPLRRNGHDLRAPLRVDRRADGSALLRINGRSVPLRVGEYSDWIEVAFRAGGIVKVRGLCRFLLRRFDEAFELYATPIQIHPGRPVMTISHPRRYSIYLSRLLGSFATAGLAEDTWALSEQRVDETAFLDQAYDIHAEREAMFFDAVSRVRRGLVACVFDGPDRIQHMFWRFLDADHPAGDEAGRAAHGHVIRDMYRRMDALVGRTMKTLDEKTVLLVMSDHGFKPFRRCVDLNAWLREHGYLHLKPGASMPGAPYLADVDWSRTRVYALGLAGMYLNLKGREGEGIVERDEIPSLVHGLCEELTGLEDPETGQEAIHEAMPRKAVYNGPYVDAAPDIIVGYNVGYRVSWDSVIGTCGPTVFLDNTKAWSGDHCIHPALAPGIFACNRPLNTEKAEIIDIAPTVLELLGVDKPGYMDGKSLLCVDERS
ncbi:MAG: alkaline phosphatase family protein [Planctomycetota bacterium]|nr:alkaline phosphatase family protein [Planctomycetota bacterium]